MKSMSIMTKRNNKEFKLNAGDGIQLKYGTVNKNNPRVIYLCGKCWVKPEEKNNYTQTISEIEREIKRHIEDIFADGEMFMRRFIFDLKFNCEDFDEEDEKLMSFEFYLRQNDGSICGIKEVGIPLMPRATMFIRQLKRLLNKNKWDIIKGRYGEKKDKNE